MTGLGMVAGALPAASSATPPEPGDRASASAAPFSDGRYVVVLRDEPLATNPATRPAPGAKVDVTTTASRSYRDRLLERQDAVLDQVRARPTYRYTTVLNGFAVELTAAEALALSERTDVASVTPDTPRQLIAEQPAADTDPVQPDTDVSPDLLGLRGAGGVWERLGGPTRAGRGTIVGVLDTGLEYTNPSFSPSGMPAPPATWKGTCDRGIDAADWPTTACNAKNIGGRYFLQGFTAAGGTPAASESRSPRDTNSHGSHVSGTAAGRDVTLPEGAQISGMAPMAHVATYKVCWDAADVALSGCYLQDSIAAIDAAVADGVDVLNYSISADPNTYQDPVDLAFKNAAAAGVFVAAAGGNGAQAGVPVAHTGPWMTTVGAAYHVAADGPVPSIAPFSARGPVAVSAARQTILKPDLGAPGVNVLAAVVNQSGQHAWDFFSGTSMASPHIAGLALLQIQARPTWSPMAVKSALLTTARSYATTASNDPFVGGTGFVEPRRMLDPGLVFTSTRADWDAFLADPAKGTALNTAYVQVPQLSSTGPTAVTRTVTNVSGASRTYTASVQGPAALEVVVEPRTVTVPAGGSAKVTVKIRNTGASSSAWQKSWVTWTASGANNVRIPVVARGPVAPAAPAVDRIGGKDRWETAELISRQFPAGADTVYLTSGRSHYDGLAGSPPASRGMVPSQDGVPGTTDGPPAPVLLVDSTTLPTATRRALQAINPTTVVILGGTAVVTQDVEDAVRASVSARIVRVGGEDRYETAALLAAQYGDVSKVYVATGENGQFADALAGGALAGAERAPVLLTKRDQVPPSVAAALQELRAEEVIVLGGTSAITDTTAAQLGATGRIRGDDRFLTAVEISKRFPFGAGQDAPGSYIATGRNFADALAGSALAGSQGVPILLVEQPSAADQIPDAVIAELERISPNEVTILGGESAVSEGVEIELNTRYPTWAQ